MKRTFMVICFLVACAGSSALAAPKDSQLPRAGAVPNEGTAIKIAEAVLEPVYGEEHIKKELPLHARCEKGIWTVYGSLPPHTLGGTVIVRIRKKDGQILEISHSL